MADRHSDNCFSKRGIFSGRITGHWWKGLPSERDKGEETRSETAFKRDTGDDGKYSSLGSTGDG